MTDYGDEGMDPLSVAAGAAISSGKKRKVKDDPKVRHALLLPAATVIGNELAGNIKDWFERGREKRLKNLDVQVERAAKITSVASIEAIADEPSFAEWAEGVSKISLKDEALSDIWQAALLAIQGGGTDRLRIISIAKRMQPDEAAAFLEYINIASPSSARRRQKITDHIFYYKRFIEYGLLRKYTDTVLSSKIVIFGISIGVVFLLIGPAIAFLINVIQLSSVPEWQKQLNKFSGKFLDYVFGSSGGDTIGTVPDVNMVIGLLRMFSAVISFVSIAVVVLYILKICSRARALSTDGKSLATLVLSVTEVPVSSQSDGSSAGFPESKGR